MGWCGFPTIRGQEARWQACDRPTEQARKVVYTGFGIGNVQGLANSLRWGLDQCIHGAGSLNGGELVPVGTLIRQTSGRIEK